jgi:hypothetical protein
MWKISPVPGFDPPTVQTVASRYTDYAIQEAHIIHEVVLFNSTYWEDSKQHEKFSRL